LLGNQLIVREKLCTFRVVHTQWTKVLPEKENQRGKAPGNARLREKEKALGTSMHTHTMPLDASNKFVRRYTCM
jgi:hypothetical protein